MRHTLLCALLLFSLNTLRCGHVEGPVLTLDPNWPALFTGESVTFTCHSRHGKGNDWRYTLIHRDGRPVGRCGANPSCSLMLKKGNSGEYQCTGGSNSTLKSNYVRLNVSDKPKPALSVSSSWLSPGASATLRCSVQDPSAGWSFYWCRAAQQRPNNSYDYQLLPGSSGGTLQASYVVRGQTHTAAYACRAGRGSPQYYTHYSKPTFVWSGDLHPASLKVSPGRAQHFDSESVSLSCGGSAAEWRVMRRSEAGHLSSSSEWGAVNGSTCNIHKPTSKPAVYWCESGPGQFSNAVNITIQKEDIILLSPVHPVTEGDSVTLGCSSRSGPLDSDVIFYRDDHRVSGVTGGQLRVAAVSKSDEGFYKCQHLEARSPRSWMSVKLSRPEGPSVLVPSIIGLVCGILLIVLLLLLHCHRKSKDSYFGRTTKSQTTNQAPDQVVTQNETSPLGAEEESSDVLYSVIQLNDIKTKGKSSPAVTQETIYSEVKPGAAPGNNAAM